jgi:hypothetical protein
MKTLVACKVLDVDAMTKLELKAFSKALHSYDNVLPKASYKCTTDEPREYRGGTLTVDRLSAGGLHSLAPKGATAAFCMLSVGHAEMWKPAVLTQPSPCILGARCEWTESLDFRVSTWELDELSVRIIDPASKSTIAKTVRNVPIASVTGAAGDSAVVEAEWGLQGAESEAASLPATATLRMRLSWQKQSPPALPPDTPRATPSESASDELSESDSLMSD